MDEPKKTDDTIDTSPDALNGGITGTTTTVSNDSGSKQKKSLLPAPLRKFSHRFNIYLLLFLLIVVIAGAILVITAMSSKKTTDNADAIKSQSLSSDTLKQLSNTNATVGDPKQTLNVQSNAVFTGSVLIKDNLEVAGQIKVGGPLSLPGITVSGESNFDQLNVSKGINIGGDAAVQGQVNVKKNLAVSGTGTFGGAITAPQITTNNLQLIGDLQMTSHIVAGGASPGRSIGGAVGGGGSASVSGSDVSGTVNVNTASSPSAGCFITINFVRAYSGTPHVMITPVGSAAGGVQYYINRTSSGFSICSANVPPANASFGFDYFVVG